MPAGQKTSKHQKASKKKTAPGSTARKSTAQRGTATRGRSAARKARATGDPLHDTWAAAMDALHSAQEEAERQLRSSLERNRISAREAATVIKNVRKRFEKERRKAIKELEAGLAGFQQRLAKERKAITKLANDAVRRTLASLNIPSRREIGELTRKVEELSRKIDSFKR